jgi:hypothetical protein
MFPWLTEKDILAINRAREVKTQKFSRTKGKTPAFSTEEVLKVITSVDTSRVVGHRDKAFNQPYRNSKTPTRSTA